MSVTDDLGERPPIQFADRGERAISGISDAEKVGHQAVIGDAQDSWTNKVH